VYDQCITNTDCGARARCSCGQGAARNTCVPLDACLRDADCGREMLCHCNAGGGPNLCGAGNCRKDIDCAAGFSCTFAQSGDNYCHTPKDTCQSQRDCASPPGRVCDYDRPSKKWACRALPPAQKRPPG
jgi:hypothetical protein